MTTYFNKKSQKSRRQVLRRNLTEAEAALWVHLRHRKIQGFKFRRQYGVGPYILDFYCPQLKLAIEVDGPGHQRTAQREYDQARTDYLNAFQITVLRFTNQQVSDEILTVVQHIKEHIRNMQSE